MPFFKDNCITPPYIGVILLAKIIAAVGYYYIYLMNGNPQGDSYDTLYGANIIFSAIHSQPLDYFKMLFGIHSDLVSDALYTPYFEKINDWSDGKTANNFFLNDNRTAVRFHAFIRLFSNGYYSVHALVMLILSFVGQWAMYKTFKNYFKGKEILLAGVVFFMPSVLFWSAGVLKEPIALFLMGLMIYSFFSVFIFKQYSKKHIYVLILSCVAFITIKPYIMALLALPLLAFYLTHCFQINRVYIFYTVFLLGISVVSIILLKVVFNRDVIKTIVVRQNDFINLSNGGIFLINDENYVRLDIQDSTQYTIVDTINKLYQIKPHTKLMYWKVYHDNDTIFVNDNQDTSLYRFVSSSLPAGSAIAMPRLEYTWKSFIKIIPKSFYNVLAKPFFENKKSLMELMASAENLMILCFFIICCVYRTKTKIDYNFLCFCMSIVVLSYLLIGLTTTVGGAIVRYKVPFLPFLMMIALLFLNEKFTKTLKSFFVFKKSR